ncbi:MAG: hypothetical protein KHY83_11595 [Coriobacteriia bacterium]|nr:hypothetical protein [Coriobacteriia bacterium]MBS5479291.1 hypothetical protein [Coriobacteriia bacterium]
MKKGFFAACMLSIAASAAVVVYAYRTDERVRETVDTAMKSVGELVGVIKERVQDKKQEDVLKEQEETHRNQAWADQQWEALGI